MVSTRYLGPQWMEFTGVPEAQQAGYRWLDCFHPGDRDRLTATLGANAEAREPLVLEFRLRDRKGDYQRFTARCSAMHDVSGRFVKWLGLCMKITNRQPSPGLAADKQRNLQRRKAVPHE